MAMIMEKDVLLEMVAQAIALISTRTKRQHPKYDEMIDIRNHLLRTDHEEIDFKEMVGKIKPVIDELKDLPDIL